VVGRGGFGVFSILLGIGRNFWAAPWFVGLYSNKPPETGTMNHKRLQAAIACCEPTKLDSLHRSPGVTTDILLCELQRVHQILSGEPYYDYDAQEWIEASN